MDALEPVETMATADQTIATLNKACVSRHFEEIWNQGALDALGNYYAADFSNFGMLMDVDRIGQIVQAWRTAFPDLHYTIDALLAEDDQVVVHCTLSGTQRGPLPLRAWAMLPVTGKQFAVKQMHIFRLRDGKFVEHSAVRDDLGMLEQLGHVVPPGRKGEFPIQLPPG
jgi:predicted ester cyclase